MSTLQETTDSYSVAKRRNIKRNRKRHKAKCAMMRRAKAQKRLIEAEPASRWEPPKLRRIVIVIDFDTGRPWMRMMQFWRGGKINQYMVKTSRGWSKKPVGFSKALAALRKGMPMVLRSPGG